MVRRLGSISGKIHLPLAAKSAAYALAWFYLPFWAFLILALYFYFVPLFHPGRTALPFAILLFFAAVEAANIWLAILFAAIFYLIIGVKDLVLIKREEASEVLSLTLIFLLAIKFFSSVDRWDDARAIFYSLILSAVFFFLAKSFVIGGKFSGAGEQNFRERSIALAALSFYISQILLVLTFLPLNFLYQSAIFIVAAAISLELVYDHFSLRLDRRRLLLQFSIFFVFMAVILGSAQWTL
ncbi:MAG: hypothetical protein AAB897_01330 [Patescibacteria group bacterium]